MTATITTILSLLTIAGQIIIIKHFLVIIFLPTHRYREFIHRYAPHLALLAVGFATVLSLYYSNVAGYPPCELCWYQRIFMYPQVILLATAFIKKRAGAMLTYTLPLSVIGLVIALYQHLLQIGLVSGAACAVLGSGAVSCAQRFIMTFGYITMPLMSATAFGLSIVAFFAYQKKKV